MVLPPLAILFVTVFASTALAYDESQPYPVEPYPHHAAECIQCHTWISEGSCTECHFDMEGKGQGPHHGYSASSKKCATCHSVHVATGSLKLLPGPTVKETCETCHDGTGGKGVYGVILARTGQPPAAQHSIDSTNVVPGGDPSTGGSAVITFTGESSLLSCDDCHSPHDSNTVDEFPGDRQRVPFSLWGFSDSYSHTTYSTKLLKRQPTGATTETAEYGSDWCLGCHKGRMSGGVVHNHPAESISSVAPTSPYVYADLPILANSGPTSSTIMGTLGGWNRLAGEDFGGNRGYLMPDPRSAQQAGHYPLCQQCHEDARTVGTLHPDGSAEASPVVITSVDGTATSDNPRFQNFPHESTNRNFLVEIGDDLCLNCHMSIGLP